jgi:hypothetical protein
MILLVFDAHKLDISDEFRDLIQAISAHTDKIRIVLNKAQEVDADRLIKVSTDSTLVYIYVAKC